MSVVGDAENGDVTVSQQLDALAVEIDQLCERMREMVVLLRRGMLYHGATIVREARDELLEVPILIRYRARD